MEKRIKKGKIFISIASYRDSELLPTITDCLNQAKYKNDIRFGICWQNCPIEKKEFPIKVFQDFRFNIYECSWKDSKGLGWARNKIQQLYNGEEFGLQLDSHHRFAKNWDALLINMMEQTNCNKPIITTYANSYDPEKKIHPEQSNNINKYQPCKMVPNYFTEKGTISFYPLPIDNYLDFDKPQKARFCSGHFFFTIGKHWVEYNYDPQLYFCGDEISLALRSFTMGYDLFHPTTCVIWHEYSRKHRVKHWDDHVSSNNLIPWYKNDNTSFKRIRHLLGHEEFQGEFPDIDNGYYGLGNIRSKKDFEEYSGIYFKNRYIDPYALQGFTPPKPNDCELFSFELDVKELLNYLGQHDDFSDGFLNDFITLAIYFQDKDKNNIIRKDLNLDKIVKLKNKNKYELQISSNIQPEFITIQSLFNSGWKNSLIKKLSK